MTDHPQDFFSHPLRVDKIPARGTSLTIEVPEAERAALARRMDLLELPEMAAEFTLTPMGKTGLIRVNGRLTAQVVQSCGVTLAPVPGVVDEEIALTYGPPQAEEDAGEGEELEVDFYESDPPDEIVDGCIDLGAVMEEHLALGLDPFPRAEGAVFEPPAEPPKEPEAKPHPFAALARLKQKK